MINSMLCAIFVFVMTMGLMGFFLNNKVALIPVLCLAVAIIMFGAVVH